MKKKIVRIIIAIILALIILLIVYECKLPGLGEFYVVKFDDKTILEEGDKKEILEILNKENEEIEINKIAYEVYFRNKSSYYIYSNNQKVYEHICFDKTRCEEYKTIKRIVRKYYKWWKNNEKNINNELENKDIYTIK